MVGKHLGIVAIQMLDRTAPHAFPVKMTAAIAFRANVLIHGAFALRTVKLLYHVRLAQLRQIAVDAASSCGKAAVDRLADLLGTKLTVWIFGKKLTDALSARRLINLF